MEFLNKARDIVPHFIAYASAVGLALWVFMGAYHDVSSHHAQPSATSLARFSARMTQISMDQSTPLLGCGRFVVDL